MSDYTRNLRIHTMNVSWSPSTVTDVTINHMISQHAHEIMKSLIAHGAKNPAVEDSLSVGIPDEAPLTLFDKSTTLRRALLRTGKLKGTAEGDEMNAVVLELNNLGLDLVRKEEI